ncbi:MAG: hypothetical protein HYY84_12050 [Deltaproteobacteria bacterium]|nr:hypothetical protein [Deltaproteobacteria bacterium]
MKAIARMNRSRKLAIVVVGLAFVTSVANPPSVSAQQQTPAQFTDALKKLYETFASKSVPFDKVMSQFTDAFKRMASFPQELASKLTAEVKDGINRLKQNLKDLPIAPLLEEAKKSFTSATIGAKKVAADLKPPPDAANPATIAKRTEEAKARFKEFGLGALQELASLPEKMKDKVKELLWMPLESISPNDPRTRANDTKILEFFRAQLRDAFAPIKNVEIAGFKPHSFIPDAAYNDFINKSSEVIAALATPGVRVFQFIRTKVKQAIGVVIKFALQQIANADELKRKIRADLARALGIPDAEIPDWVLEVASKLATTLGQAVGGIGTYVLNMNAELKEVVVTAIDAMASTAESLDEAMKAAIEMGSAFGGDNERASNEAADALARAKAVAECANLPATADEALKNRCSGVPRNLDALKAAIARAERIAAAKREGEAGKALPPEMRDLKIRLAEVLNKKSNAMKREKFAEAIDKVLLGVSNAFVAAATPALQQAATLLNMVLVPVLQSLSAVIKEVITLIPWVGGAGALVWDVVATISIPILVQIPPAIIIPVSVDIVSEEIKALRDQFLAIWDDKGGPDLFKRAQGAVKSFERLFKPLMDGLVGLRQGLQEGAAAIFKGPIVSVLMSKLPYGLGQVLMDGVEAGLSAAFPANGQFDFDIVNVTVKVLEAVKPALLGTLKDVGAEVTTRMSTKAAQRLTKYLSDVVQSPGASKAFDDIVAELKDKKDFGALFEMKLIRRVLGDLVHGTAGITVDFVLGELVQAGATLPPCAETLKGGVVNAIQSELVPIIKGDGNDIAEVFQKGGLAAVIPRAVQVAMKKPAAGEAPLVQFFVCAVEKNLTGALRTKWDGGWKKRVTDALYASAGLIATEENINKLLAKGFPGLMEVVFQIGGPLLAGLIAEVLGDPALEQELGAAFVAVGGAIGDGALAKTFATDGIMGIFADLAGKDEVKRALLNFVGRRLGEPALAQDPDVSAAYTKVVAAIRAAKNLTVESFKSALYPAARFAFKRAIKWGVLGKEIAKQRIKPYLVGFVRAMKPFGVDVGAAFEQSVVPVLDAGDEAFFAKLAEKATPCAERIQESRPNWPTELRDCVVQACGGAVAAAGSAVVKQTVIELSNAAKDTAGNEKLVANIETLLQEGKSVLGDLETKVAALAQAAPNMGEQVRKAISIAGAFRDASKDLLGKVADELRRPVAMVIASALRGGMKPFASDIYGGANDLKCAKEETNDTPATYALRAATCVLRAARDAAVVGFVRGLAQAAREAGKSIPFTAILRKIIAAMPDVLKKLGAKDSDVGPAVKETLVRFAGDIAAVGDEGIRAGANDYATKIDPTCATPRKKDDANEKVFTKYLDRVANCLVDAAPASFKAGRDALVVGAVKRIAARAGEVEADGKAGKLSPKVEGVMNELETGLLAALNAAAKEAGAQGFPTFISQAIGVFKAFVASREAQSVKAPASQVTAKALQEAFGALAASTFKDDSDPRCARKRKTTPKPEEEFKAYVGAAITCVANGARDALVVGAVKGLAEASRQLAENVAFFDAYKWLVGKMSELLGLLGVTPADLPDAIKTKLNGLVSDISRLGNVAVKTGAIKFASELDTKCTAPRAAAKAFAAYLKETAECVYNSAKGSLVAGAGAAADQLPGAKAALEAFARVIESGNMTTLTPLIKAVNRFLVPLDAVLSIDFVKAQISRSAKELASVAKRCISKLTALDLASARSFIACMEGSAP